MSHKYNDVLIGLNGSKSILTFFSLPSSVTISPQYITKPFVGTLLYNLSLACTDVMALSTDCLLTRDLIFVAVPSSSANIFATRGI